MKQKITIHWFRRDLRLDDNAALYHALKNHENVLPLFIFDKNILDDLEDQHDARVTFIHDCITIISAALAKNENSILVKYGKPETIWREITEEFIVEAVYANHDYEPYAAERDLLIKNILAKQKIPFNTYKDQVIFEKNEIVKEDGTPYVVYTPYSKKWKEKLDGFYLKPYPVKNYAANFYKGKTFPVPALQTMGFYRSAVAFPPAVIRENLIKEYDKTRNFPGIDGTSKLSLHLRFGTISIRHLTKRARGLNEKYFHELIWREFYQMILWHFPQVVHHAFRKEYDDIVWRNNQTEFALWCAGQTGYPLVDAGMRELNATGYMHNRVRMVTASFLTKDLLIDWRWGEAYFAKKLLDYDLASNNGGWQWSAGTGVDAAPYFRIFNPAEQLRKFDPDLMYVKKWVPEFETLQYTQPIVDHAFARHRCLQEYKKALEENK